MASSLTCGLVLFGLLSCFSVADPIVDLGYAKYRGKVDADKSLVTYSGLQYAAPPIGPLRWQPPVPIDNSSIKLGGGGVIDATDLGPTCVQTMPTWFESVIQSLIKFNVTSLIGPGFSLISAEPSEDCLRLDVIVPEKPHSKPLPVVLQIPGGGYTLGSSTVIYDGSEFVSESNGSIIYVQIQYRLGPYGWLAGKEVRDNGTLNAGLLDQRVAFEWVKRNIHAFGGDPNQITLWGGSAGGGSVSLQMMFRGGEDPEPPFHACIAEYPWWQPFHKESVQERQYNDLLAITGCPDIRCLRGVSFESLKDASQKVYTMGFEKGQYGFGDFYFGPVVDGDIIRELPSDGFRNGNYNKVPLLTDRDNFEGFIFSNLSLKTEDDVRDDVTARWPHASPSLIDELLQKQYPISDYSSYPAATDTFLVRALSAAKGLGPAFYQAASLFSDYAVDCPSSHIAQHVSSTGSPVYRMKFNIGLGIHASTALPLLVTSSPISGNKTVADYMKDYFLSFILSQDPNKVSRISKPHWPQYHDTDYLVLTINDTDIAAEFDSDRSSRCEFFMSNGDSFQN